VQMMRGCHAEAVLLGTDYSCAELAESFKRERARVLQLSDLPTPMSESVDTELAWQDSDPMAPCYLQLSSGSSGEPSALAVSHHNLVSNVRATHSLLRTCGESEVGVSWLPLWHDMGLVSGLLTPLLARSTEVLIQPQVFASQPRVWLETISEQRATITATSNFGLQLALKRPVPCNGLDLSTLHTVLVGAEPIQPEVLRDFARHYAPAGLSSTALCPAYGLAEATLAVSVSEPDARPTTLRLDRSVFDREQLVAPVPHASPESTLEIVSCGRPLPDHRVNVVSPDGELLPERAVGEIMIEGPSLAVPHARRDAANSSASCSPLRTGDLGFFHRGELYVCGRTKDLIIVGGRNLHPQQVEWCASKVSGVREGAVVAFSVPGRSTEQLVVVYESENAHRDDGVSSALVQRVAAELCVHVSDVCCVRPFSVPKTSSGKLRRAEARRRYLAGELGFPGA
jgi:fatty-acyl-CoA synthase